MTRYFYPFLILIGLIFGSCQTIEQLSIDYMMPAEVSFPPELRRVAIVNNMSDIPDNKWIESESPKKEGEIARAVALHNGDSKIAVESLAEAIAKENYFDEVVICDSALRANDKFARESTLTQEEVKDLTDQLNVDFLISLENLQLKATKTISFLPEYNCYYGSIDMLVYPTLKVYLPMRKSPMLTINANDSIFWEEYGNTDAYVRTHIISDSKMLEEASDFAGTVPVKHLLPYWKSATRYLYTNGSVDMRDAAIYVRENSWDKAFKLWDKVFKSAKSDKKKMYAALNIALYYEMKDDVDQAETWAVKAQELASKVENIDKRDTSNLNLNNIPNYVMTTLYVGELKERKAGLSRLNVQMSRFNDDF